MTGEEPGNSDARGLNSLAKEIMASLAAQFPVCMASDEFHFFPQATDNFVDGFPWDDFSPDAVEDVLGRLKGWRTSLDQYLSLPASSEQIVESAMLRRILKTLGEQFNFVKVQETQPTFYLTIIGIGLAEAAESGGRVWMERLEHLPGFLDQARRNLIRMPRLFRDIGLDMLVKQRSWLNSLKLPDSCRTPIFDAFGRLHTHLEQASVQEDFLPEIELYERIASDHMGCLLSPDDIARELEMEIVETRSILEESAIACSPGNPWQVAIKNLARPAMPAGGIGAIYRNAISKLADHCKKKGLVSDELVQQCPVKVVPIPDYMGPVRSNAAYSMPPGYPPQGGTFFIVASDKQSTVPVDYRLLTAHETFPGHHLLDACRWRQTRIVRRHIEFPIFYEGWASFAEELMFETGFFSGPADRMLMAKRRFWRAIRGQIDFDIHMRRQTIDEAAALLASTGMPRDRAKAMVRRYSLKPGYQLAYTIGRCRFRRLYDAWRRKGAGPAAFAQRVLEQGEIGFQHLEQIVMQGG